LIKASTLTSFSFGGQQQLGQTQANQSFSNSSLTQPQSNLFNTQQQQQPQTSLQNLTNSVSNPGLQSRQTLPLNATQSASLDQQEQDQLTNAIVNPQAFYDERDSILSKWNQLQSFYGFGKVFFQNSAFDISKDNRYTRFKVTFFNYLTLNYR
jgi:nuclear pore complex protein Nup54